MALQQQYLQQMALLSNLNPVGLAQTLAAQQQQLQQQLQQQHLQQQLHLSQQQLAQAVLNQGHLDAGSSESIEATAALLGSVVGLPTVPHEAAGGVPTPTEPGVAYTASPATPSAALAHDAESGLSVTGRPPIVLYMTCDDDALSDYQCLVRKNIELFEAQYQDIESNAQGRNRPIVLGQVGIQCKHCTHLPPKHRARGAVYYPAKLEGLYQAAQNQANGHLAEHCNHVPAEVRAELIRLKDRKSSAGGGKKYWADGVRVLGVYEDAHGLRFKPR